MLKAKSFGILTAMQQKTHSLLVDAEQVPPAVCPTDVLDELSHLFFSVSVIKLPRDDRSCDPIYLEVTGEGKYHQTLSYSQD